MRHPLYIFLITVITITLTACSGSSTGSDPDDDNNEPVTFTISVDITPSEAGTISPSTEETYEESEEIELQANPDEKYVFTGWSGDIESSNNPLPVTVDQDYELTANFELKSYELVINTDGEGSVQEEILEQPSKEYEHGTVVELTATPAQGYRFVEWQGDVTGSENPAEITVDDPKEVTAVFEKKTYALSTSTTGEGTLSLDPDQDSYEHGTSVEVSAAPETGWEFSSWDGDASGSDNPLTIIIDADKELTAVFEEKQTYSLTTYTTGEGTVNANPDQSEYEAGSTVELTAYPGSGWEFVEWTGDVESTENPIEITMDQSKEVTAIFEAALFYQDHNRITILCPDAEIGESGTVDGVTYTKRSVDQITPSNAATTCTSGITDMEGLFMDEPTFDEDISHWDVSSVEEMGYMFESATDFNQNIGQWDVSTVKSMDGMFSGAESFNQDIGNWDVANVTDMRWMFEHTDSFNQGLSSWDVSSVTQMRNMFFSATAFDQDLSTWCVSNIDSEPDYFAVDAAFEDDTHKFPDWGTCPE